MKTALKLIPIFILSFSGIASAADLHSQSNPRCNMFVIAVIAQRMIELEAQGLKSTPATRQERIAEIKLMHDKIMSSKKLKAKFQKNRNIYGTQDTHLHHHGNRNSRIK